MMNRLPFVIGAADTGLTGPYAFAPKWTFQRRGERQVSARKRARHLRAQNGEALRGVALYVEAVEPPLKAIRHLLTQLAQVVWIHADHDIGYAELRRFFPGEADEASIDFADDTAILASPREGTRWFFGRWHDWFWQRYAELQARALANGRYFPSPGRLCVRLAADRRLRIDLAYARGFLPGNKWYVLSPTERGFRGRSFLLTPDEPPPRHGGMQGFLHECALRFARPGESVLIVDGILQGHDAPRAIIQEGDALDACALGRYEWQRVKLFWQGQYLGQPFNAHAQMRQWLSERKPLRIRVVRIGLRFHPFCPMAYAVYAPRED